MNCAHLKIELGKIDLTQIFPINKYRNARKTITVCTSAPMRRVSSHILCTVITCPVWGYTTRWCVKNDIYSVELYRGPEVLNKYFYEWDASSLSNISSPVDENTQPSHMWKRKWNWLSIQVDICWTENK